MTVAPLEQFLLRGFDLLFSCCLYRGNSLHNPTSPKSTSVSCLHVIGFQCFAEIAGQILSSAVRNGQSESRPHFWWSCAVNSHRMERAQSTVFFHRQKNQRWPELVRLFLLTNQSSPAKIESVPGFGLFFVAARHSSKIRLPVRVSSPPASRRRLAGMATCPTQRGGSAAPHGRRPAVNVTSNLEEDAASGECGHTVHMFPPAIARTCDAL